MKNKVALKKFINFAPDNFQEYVAKKISAGEVELNDPYIKRVAVPNQYTIFEGEERVLLATTSKIDGVDRDNEIVLTENIDLEAYRLNPLLMKNHSWSEDPVGHAIMSITTIDRLRQKFIFDEDERSLTTFRKYQSKSLRAFSAGFLPKRVIKNGSKEFGIIADKLMMLGLVSKADIDKTQRILESSILLETSAVSIPANAKAMVEAVSADDIPNTPIIINDTNKDAFEAEIPIVIQQDGSRTTELAFPGKDLTSDTSVLKVVDTVEEPEVEVIDILDGVEDPKDAEGVQKPEVEDPIIPVEDEADTKLEPEMDEPEVEVIDILDGVEDPKDAEGVQKPEVEDPIIPVEDEADTKLEPEMDEQEELDPEDAELTAPQIKTVMKLYKKATPVVYRELTKEDVHEIIIEKVYRLRGGI